MQNITRSVPIKFITADFMECLFSASLRSTYRAICLIVATMFIASNIRNWIQMSLRISPILSILVVLMTMYVLGQLWKKYAGDVNITFFRILKHGMAIFKHIHRDLMLTRGEQISAEQYPMKTKFIRVLVLFLMAQHCIVPKVSLLWLHTLLMLKFTADIVIYLQLWLQHQNTNTVSYDRDNQTSSRITFWGIFLFKLIYSCSFLYYTSFYISIMYLFVATSYYIISQHSFENQITKSCESMQLDIFEGMEHYYISGIFGFTEMLYAVVFMVWSLICNKQMIMFVALYTNIYQGGKEIINFTSLAFTEWTNLAQFERASKSELSSHDDVCAICLCVMKSARKTPCKHFFHGHCLRRCLKEKNVCPLCTSPIEKM